MKKSREQDGDELQPFLNFVFMQKISIHGPLNTSLKYVYIITES